MMPRALPVVLLVSSCNVETDQLRPPGVADQACASGYMTGIDENSTLICDDAVDGLRGGTIQDGLDIRGNVKLIHELTFDSTTSGGTGPVDWKLEITGPGAEYDSLYFSSETSGSFAPHVVFRPNGSVGIGTQTPLGKLEVREGASGATFFATAEIPGQPAALIHNEDDSRVSFKVSDESSDATPFVIDNDGRVGVGTASPDPTSKLDVAGDGHFGTDGRAIVGNFGSEAVVGGYGSSLRLVAGSPTVPRVFIDQTTGNVGVGTAEPTERLDVGIGNIRLIRASSYAREGLLILGGGAARPPCDDSTRGAIAYEAFGASDGFFCGCTGSSRGWRRLDASGEACP